MSRPIDQRATQARQIDLIEAALRQVESAGETLCIGEIRPDGTRWPTNAAQCETPGIRSLKGYQIEAEVHRGGQGVVYRATQESTGKLVAIKVILGGRFAGPQQLARFEREVRILAQLRHPNIVTIHDSDVMNGVAYYVMDFIEGCRLDVFLRDECPTTRDKLQLFERICHAVNAAHLHGVIHRDLKPGNILVDQHGNPHVLDFGLAKPIGDADDISPEMTQTGQFVGSLPWASPEQALGSADGVDLRTDVYSLGVILFQAITESFPYSLRGSPGDVVWRIAHEEPANPTMIDHHVDADLATITLTSLEKDRARRYQSAGALAEDVRRYLDGEPIDARRASLLYLLRKRLVRHKWLAAFAAMTLISIVVGLVVSLWLWRVASYRALLAQQHASRAETVQKFLADTLASADISAGGKASITVRNVIDESVRQLDEHPFSEPEIESTLRLVIGRTYGSLGLHGESERELRKSRELALKAFGSESTASLEPWSELIGVLRQMGRNQEAEQMLAECMAALPSDVGNDSMLVAQLINTQATMARDRGDYVLAEAKSREALRMARSINNSDEQVAILLNDLALALEALGRAPEAMQAQEEALTLFRQSLGPDHFRTAVALSNLAGLRLTSGERSKAETLYAQALQVFRAVGGERSLQVATCLDALGRLHAQARDLPRAIKAHGEALEIRRDLLPAAHTLIANSLNNLALCHYELGDLDHALDCFDQALVIYVVARGEDHPAIATLQNNIAGIAWVSGKLTKAETHLRRALEINRQHFPEDHPDVAKIRHNLGRVLEELGQLAEAQSLLRGALDVRIAVLGADHLETVATMDALASVLRRLHQFDEAEQFCRRALETRSAQSGNDSLEVADSLSNLAGLLVDRDRAEEALPLAMDSVRIAELKLPQDHWRKGVFRANRAKVLEALERFDEAIADWEQAHQMLREQFGADDHRVMEMQAQLARVHLASGRRGRDPRETSPTTTAADE